MQSPQRMAAAAALAAATGLALIPLAATPAFAKGDGGKSTTTTTTVDNSSGTTGASKPKPPPPTHSPKAYPPKKGHHGSVTPKKASHKDEPVTVEFTADGFNPGEAVDIYINHVYQTTVNADSNGVAVFDYTFGPHAVKSDYQFQAIGEDTNIKDDANFHLTAFLIPATSSHSSGSDTGMALGIAALGMLSVGSGSIWTMRRRRRAAR